MLALKPHTLKPPIPPNNPVSRALIVLVLHPVFDAFIMLCILLQIVLLALPSFGQSDALADGIDKAGIALALVFLLEAVFKLGALGPSQYFKDGFNCLDCVTVLGSVAGLITLAVTGTNSGLIVNIMRIFRVGRLIKLLNNVKSLQRLIKTIYLTLPAVINICLVLCLLLYVFAVIGVGSFAKVAFNNTYNELSNFRSFPVAFLTLIRFLIGEGWGNFMYDASVALGGCDPDPIFDASVCGFSSTPGCTPLNGCGDPAVVAFMVLFVILVSFIFLPLFVAAIIDGYTGALSGLVKKPDDFEAFAETWSAYDANSTMLIPLRDLRAFVSAAQEPLGFANKVHSRRQYLKRVGGVPVLAGRFVQFYDVLKSLSRAHHARQAEAGGEQDGGALDAAEVVTGAAYSRLISKSLKFARKRSNSIKALARSTSGKEQAASSSPSPSSESAREEDDAGEAAYVLISSVSVCASVDVIWSSWLDWQARGMPGRRASKKPKLKPPPPPRATSSVIEGDNGSEGDAWGALCGLDARPALQALLPF